MIIRTDEPIFIHRRVEGHKDEYGNPTFATETILVRNVLFAFQGGSEPVQVEREPLDARLSLYFPPGTEILDGDEFEIRETMWVKDGEPDEWQKIWPGFTPGVVVRVRKRVG